LIDSIWSELKKYFDLYDKNNKGFLTEAEFKTFIVEVLQEISEK
jgi:Ca2+-binding EF-hand superfamily protein